MERIFNIIIVLMSILWVGCKEEGRIDYIDSSAPAPSQVRDVTVRNTPGGAVLKYKVPDDENLLSVKAIYEIQPGVQRETESSYYKDSLVLEGFGDTRTYDVRLYSIGKNEKASDPLTVQINPTTAPVFLATKQLREAFGGVGISIQNPERTNLAVILMGDTAQMGYQSYLETFFSSSDRANFTLRGLDTIPCNYSVYLRDRWNNLSDTIEATLTPWFEELIPTDSWREVYLPTDFVHGITSSNFLMRNMWNGETTAPMIGFNATNQSPLPWWVTWDMGITIKLSRLKLWHFVDYEWTYGNPKKFELWGAENPDPDGSWEGWTCLGRFECIRPSGSASITAEDIEFAKEGFDFEIEVNEFSPDPFVPVRYIRYVHVETWGSALVDKILLKQIRFWGIIQK